MQPAKSSVTPRGRIEYKTSRRSYASVAEPLLRDRDLRDQDHRRVRRDRAEGATGAKWFDGGTVAPQDRRHDEPHIAHDG